MSAGAPRHREACVEAQSKLNLCLRVLGREDDGYHRIETLFQRISLADTVRVRTGSTVRTLDCSGADTGPTERNLAWRAALAFDEATGWPGGFAIEIEKRIPVGGGLGGGSADAGAVLRALNALSPAPLDEPRLLAIAERLGADVPFLTTTLPLAIGRGRGERLLGVEPLPAARLVLLAPPFAVRSADAYAWLDTGLADGGAPVAPLAPADLRSWHAVARHARNDLEAPVFAHHPELDAWRRALEAAGATVARMSGSGSTVFALYAPADAAPTRNPLAVVAHEGSRMLLAQTLERVAPLEVIA